jgi:hypothetical protein
MISDRSQTALEIRRLVFDDHVEAERLPGCHGRIDLNLADFHSLGVIRSSRIERMPARGSAIGYKPL